MFKKFKDKLAEEVKSSPQRIQQFAQAAQAAVTSASSSISDITNNDLFSIGDSDNSTKTQLPNSQPNTSQNLNQSSVNSPDFADFSMGFENQQRQRRLSNSSFASDISFQLPNYESPSMYHLQSDMDVSASEAEEIIGNVNLNRVTKEQLYAAYRRTQERWKKYKTQYSDLARHYKLLERENAKARNVLVETQDKALRRISELKEQCSLEQSAKAHLEQALRVELDERNMKIDTLNAQLNLLQNDNHVIRNDANDNAQMQLINLSADTGKDMQAPEAVNIKIGKLEQLLSKYKESLKIAKEKNSNLTTEIQKLNMHLEAKTNENNELQRNIDKMNDGEQKIQELLNKIESLENLNSTLEFSKSKDVTFLESNLRNSEQEIVELQNKIKILSKREEEYAISLAENKLRIHKELETKESEIKALKDSLENGYKEIATLEKTVEDSKKQVLQLEAEIGKLNDALAESSATKSKLDNLNKEHDAIKEKCKQLESNKAKYEENINCLNLQLKQETAEKLSVIDRNVYLENRNAQLADEITKKRSQMNKMEEEVAMLRGDINELKTTQSQHEQSESSASRLAEEATAWKLKCTSLESEIQEERVELGKLQSEIEKLLRNHESLQNRNVELGVSFEKLQSENIQLYNEVDKYKAIKMKLAQFKRDVADIRTVIGAMSNEARSLNEQVIRHWLPELRDGIVRYENLASAEMADLKTCRTTLNEQNANITTECDNLIKNADSMRVDNEKLRAAMHESETERERLNGMLNNLNKDNEALKSDLQRLSALENENTDLCNRIEALVKEAADLRKELGKVNELYKSSLEQIETLTRETFKASETKQEHEENLKRIKELENDLEITKQENANLLASKMEMEKLYQTLESEMNQLRSACMKKESDYEALRNESDGAKLKQEEMQEKCDRLEADISEINNAMECLKDENNNLRVANVQTETRLDEIKAEFNQARQMYENELKKLKEENNSLKSSQTVANDELKRDYEEQVKLIATELDQVRESYETKLKKFIEENNSLRTLQSQMDVRLKGECEKQINVMEAELNGVRESYENEIKRLNDEITSLKASQSEMDERFMKENESQINAMKAELNTVRETYENKLKQLSEENRSLKASQVEIKEIEAELNQVRENYESRLVKLNNEIDLLKSSHDDVNKKIANAESELNDAYRKYSELEVAKRECDRVIIDMETKITSQNKVIEEQERAISSRNACECDRLKEDNRRLRSDIEGHQTYLAKISKENSELNDKLREVLASENTSDGELKAEIQSGKEKINELLRENSLLIEENLELKDQIQNSAETRPPNKDESANDKFKQLQEAKSNLEMKVRELEEMNLSLNRSMDQNQNNNERLKLSNEKLQRKLDEALVSLRHLHALEENTELEYLRNILYEYLTGPGSHSLTLAKVLSAVVRFDDRQTEQVLLKEKERQGFLHQLGII